MWTVKRSGLFLDHCVYATS